MLKNHKKELNMDITHDYKFMGMLYVAENGSNTKIEYKDGKYSMETLAPGEDRWFPAGEMTAGDAVGMTSLIAAKKGIEEFKLNGKQTNSDEFHRAVFNVELKNKLPLVELANVKEIADWNEINKIITDGIVSKHEYKTFKKILGKYDTPYK